MTRVRRLAVVLIAIGLVLSAVYATGAFDSMTASRNANVEVVGDASGYIGLKPASGPNGAYASLENGKLRVSVTEAAETAGGSGVNAHGTTRIADVFTVTNQGATPIALWFSETDSPVTLERSTSEQSLQGKTNAIELSPGTSIAVSLAIETGSVGPGTTFRPLLSLHTSSDLQALNASKPGGADSDGPNTGANPGTATPEADSSVENTPQTPDSTNTPNQPDQSETVSFGPLDIEKQHAEAFKDGLVYGEVGMPTGANPQDTASSPYYLLAQLSIGFVPGLGDAADVRDAVQSAMNGDVIGTLIGGAAAIPGLGAIADGTKLTDFAKDWIKRFGSRAKELTRLFATHVATHMPDDLAIELLDVFSKGRASELQDNGKSVDEIIERAKKGTLDKDPNKKKKLVTDGGTSAQELRQVDIPKKDINYYQQKDIPFKSVKSLRKKRMKPETIREYAESGHSPRTINTLIQQGFLTHEVKDLHKQGYNLRKIIYLRDEFVPRHKINDWAHKGHDIDKIWDTISTYKQKSVDVGSDRRRLKGAIAELAAESSLENKYPNSYTIARGVDIKDSNGHKLAEIDVLVLDESGRAVETYQVKSGKSPAVIGDANGQISKVNERYGDMKQISPDSGNIDIDDMPDSINNAKHKILVPEDAPKKKIGHSLENLDLSSKEIAEITDAIMEYNIK